MKERRIMRGLQTDLQVTGFATEELLAPEQALTLFFSRAQLLARAVETVPLESAAGRLLAAGISADRDYPLAARSGLDGVALRAQDAAAELHSAGEIRMGEAWTAQLAPETAVRIPTGGVLPPGADCVAPVEDTAVTGDRVRVRRALTAGENVVPAGSDMRSGEHLLE